MKRPYLAFIPLGLFILLVALFALPLIRGSDPALIASAMVGKKVPDFALSPALTDKPGLSTKDLLKEPVLVNFFSSWCVTCVAEQPFLAQLAEKDKIAIYGIDYKDKKNDVADWLMRHGNPYKAVGFDEDGRVAIDWGVYGVPETYIVAPDGTIAYRFVGAMAEDDYKNVIKPKLEALRQ